MDTSESNLGFHHFHACGPWHPIIQIIYVIKNPDDLNEFKSTTPLKPRTHAVVQ